MQPLRVHGRDLFGLGSGFGPSSGNACFDECMVGQTLQQSEPDAAETCAGNCGFLSFAPYVQCVTDNQDAGDSDPYGHCVQCCAPNPHAPNPQNNPTHLPAPVRFPLNPGQFSPPATSSAPSSSSSSTTAAVVGKIAVGGAGAALLFLLLK